MELRHYGQTSTMNDIVSIAGFILAGGESSRMGVDKGLLEIAGVPMIARAARLVESVVGSPVVVVDKIVAPHDMSDPDSIKSGWSEERLWDTWLAFLAGSVAVSIWLACLKWTKFLGVSSPRPAT